jgi:hypothetical protein
MLKLSLRNFSISSWSLTTKLLVQLSLNPFILSQMLLRESPSTSVHADKKLVLQS